MGQVDWPVKDVSNCLLLPTGMYIFPANGQSGASDRLHGRCGHRHANGAPRMVPLACGLCVLLNQSLSKS